jgi:hypothetical protein
VSTPPSTRNKSFLVRKNNVAKKRPNAINNDFGDYFINHVVKANRSKLPQGFRPMNLRIKTIRVLFKYSSILQLLKIKRTSLTT